MLTRTRALVAVLGVLAVMLLPAGPADAAGSCGPIPQIPYRTEIGNTNTYLIHYPIAISCTSPIVSSTAYGTLTRNGTPYDAKADEQAPLHTFVVHDMVTACPPATQATYTSSIGAVIVMLDGSVALIPAQRRSAIINCALF